MNKAIFSWVASFFVAFLGVAATSQAAVILAGPVATDKVAPPPYAYGGVGYFFSANSSGTAKINQLGYEDKSGLGLANSHEVALYQYDTSAGAYQVVAKTTVLAGTASPLINGYRYASIPTFTLTITSPGDYYAVVASYDGVAQTYEGPNSVTNAPGGTAIGTITGNGFAVSSIGAVGSYITGGYLNYQWGGANARFAEVPEPASLGVIGLAGLWLMRRRSEAGE